MKQRIEECDSQESIQECFESIRGPFDDLETKHKQQKFYREHCGLLVSQHIHTNSLTLLLLSSGTCGTKFRLSA